MIKSLLRTEGLNLAAYAAHFGTSAVEDFTELATLEDEGLLETLPDRIVPTASGLERSDAIGPWLERRDGPLVVDAKITPDYCAPWLAEAFN